MKGSRSEASPTIVGGQPMGKRDSREGSPRNIERIVLELASDESFRGSFRKDRKHALADAGIVLSPEEEKILGSISDGELLAMAGVLTPTGEDPSRRRFLRAAASLAALSGVGALSCEDRRAVPEGIQPEMPTPHPTSPTSMGDRIDMPPALQIEQARAGAASTRKTPVPSDIPATRGIQADIPQDMRAAPGGIRTDDPGAGAAAPNASAAETAEGPEKTTE